MLKIESLTRRYPHVTALDGLNMEIGHGQLYGFVGPNGAGKTTTIRIISGLLRPTSGKVFISDEELTAMSPAELRQHRKKIGMIFQQFNILAQRNVLQNVCFPLEIAGSSKTEARQRAEELLALVGLEDRMKAYPAQLSGGQKQRVAIARAMANNAKVVLCDEATSALDPNTNKSILGLLKRINLEMGITVIVITHEMSVIESICDRVAIIDHSHIAEVGKVSDVFSGPKSDIGRQLILGDVAGHSSSFGSSRQIRIIFDGRESSEPVIANMVLACKVPVNIMHADTRDIEGKAMGQMLIQLPEDESDAGRICNYLKTANVTFEEVR